MSLALLETPKTGFVATRPIFCWIPILVMIITMMSDIYLIIYVTTKMLILNFIMHLILVALLITVFLESCGRYCSVARLGVNYFEKVINYIQLHWKLFN